METVVQAVVAWVLLSIPVSLLVARFLAGNRRRAEAVTEKARVTSAVDPNFSGLVSSKN